MSQEIKGPSGPVAEKEDWQDSLARIGKGLDRKDGRSGEGKPESDPAVPSADGSKVGTDRTEKKNPKDDLLARTREFAEARRRMKELAEQRKAAGDRLPDPEWNEFGELTDRVEREGVELEKIYTEQGRANAFNGWIRQGSPVDDIRNLIISPRKRGDDARGRSGHAEYFSRMNDGELEERYRKLIGERKDSFGKKDQSRDRMISAVGKELQKRFKKNGIDWEEYQKQCKSDPEKQPAVFVAYWDRAVKEPVIPMNDTSDESAGDPPEGGFDGEEEEGYRTLGLSEGGTDDNAEQESESDSRISGKSEASLRKELESWENYIREKGREREELEKRLETLDGSKGDLGKAEEILTGAVSIGPTREKIRKELSEKIKLVDEHIRTAEEEMRATKEESDRLPVGSEAVPRAVESGNDGADIVIVEPEASIGSGDGKGIEVHEPEPEGRIAIFNSDAEPEKSEVAEPTVPEEAESETPTVAGPSVLKETEPEKEAELETPATAVEVKPETETDQKKEKAGASVEDKEPAPVSEAARERFKSLGIWEKELSSFDFSGLSEGQQVLVAEMLRQTAARNVEDRAQEKAKEGLSIFRSFRLAKARKEFASGVGNGGVGEYGDELRQLIEGVRVSGLDMEEKDGKFDTRFFSPTESMRNDESLKTESEAFNEAANRFSKIPFEWSYEEATEEQRKAYGDGKKVFEDARDRMERAMFSPDRGESAKGYADLTKEYGAIRVAENRVRLMQQLTAHPEVGEYLDTLEYQNTFLAGLKSVASERFGYFVGGAAARAALIGTLGLFAAPAVAVVSGGFMGYRRAKETLIEHDRQARRGKDTATKVVPGEGAGWFKKLIGKPETISQEKLEAGKRLMVRASVSKEESDGDGRKRGLAERLDIINGRIAKLSPDDEETMNKELGMLAARVEYVKKKLDSDQVNFGDGTEGIRSRVILLEALSRAEMNLGVFAGDKDPGNRFDRRFGQAQKDEDARVKNAREKYVRYETGRGAVMAGTISLIGVGVTSAVREASAALQHAPGSGSASRHLNDIYGAKGPGMIKDAPAPGAGPGVARLANEAIPKPSGAGTGAAAETLKQTATETVANKGMKAVEAAGKTYAETANRGEGMTHLARRAFAEYSGNRTDLADLKPEQKVYIEDYLQKHIAHSGTLHPGDRIEFPRDLMDEAIGKARGLGQAQIDNLHQYSERVAEFRTGTPSVAEHVGTPSGESVRSVASGAEASVGNASVPTNIAEQLPPSGSVRIDMNETLPWEPNVREWTPGYDDGRILYPTLDKAPESVIRSMARNREAIEFLSGDTRRLMPFQETMRTISGDLFPSGTGGMDKRMFLEIGGRSSKDVFKACFLSVDNPSRGSEFGMEADEAGRLGKFLLAAHDRYGISPNPDGSETFREYLERVSVVMVGKLDRASTLRDVRVSDDRLRAFAGAFAAKR